MRSSSKRNSGTAEAEFYSQRPDPSAGLQGASDPTTGSDVPSPHSTKSHQQSESHRESCDESVAEKTDRSAAMRPVEIRRARPALGTFVEIRATAHDAGTACRATARAFA